MSKYNLARKLFDFEEYDSDNSDKSVIYISSSEDESSDWETDCSTDTEQLIARIEKEVTSSPMLIGGRIMTMDEPEDEARAGPSTSQMEEGVTPKLGLKYFDREMCYAPPKKFEKKRIDLCNTIMPVLESPLSPPRARKGSKYGHPPSPASSEQLSCVTPRPEFSTLPECQRSTLYRMHGLRPVGGLDQRRKGKMVYAAFYAKRRTRVHHETQKGSI